MEIRKLLKFEHAHIVRDCHTERCKFNIHGHSYKVEIFLSAFALDKAGMVVDFALVKKYFPVVDMWDHAMSVWEKDLPTLQESVKTFNQRWIVTPFNTSAENMAVYFMKYACEKAIPAILADFPEYFSLECSKIIVHETDTGCAVATQEDVSLGRYDLEDVIYSEGCLNG